MGLGGEARFGGEALIRITTMMVAGAHLVRVDVGEASRDMGGHLPHARFGVRPRELVTFAVQQVAQRAARAQLHLDVKDEGLPATRRHAVRCVGEQRARGAVRWSGSGRGGGEVRERWTAVVCGKAHIWHTSAERVASRP